MFRAWTGGPPAPRAAAIILALRGAPHENTYQRILPPQARFPLGLDLQDASGLPKEKGTSGELGWTFRMSYSRDDRRGFLCGHQFRAACTSARPDAAGELSNQLRDRPPGVRAAIGHPAADLRAGNWR